MMPAVLFPSHRTTEKIPVVHSQCMSVNFFSHGLPCGLVHSKNLDRYMGESEIESLLGD